jgi:hypothetical protein
VALKLLELLELERVLFVRIVSRMPIFPTSCSSAACRIASRRSSAKPRLRASATA